MTHSTFDRWLLGAGGLVALLVVAVVLTFENTRQLNDDARRVAHTHEVRDTLAEASGHLREAEAVQRTYLIVGGDTFPPDFAANIDAARQNVGQVKGLIEDNQEQQARIPAIENGLEELAGFWTRTMFVRQKQGFDAAKQIVAAEQSNMLAELQGRLRQMDDTERVLLRGHSDKRERTYNSALATGLLSGLAAVAGVVAFMVLLRRHLAALTAAAAVIAEQGERLRTTLASIGDAVITIDITGRITGMNAVAEALTGWKLAEAPGQSLEDVFRIVNEQTRQAVKNPATRALTEGVIVGLANHTILIARDGTERPIDDSAAPIRCKDGQIVGSVLVFRDVTERRRDEQALRKQAELLQQQTKMLDLAHILIRDVNGCIRFWNSGAVELYGFTETEAVGRISHDLLRTVFPQPLNDINAIVLRDGHWQGELIHTRKDGQRLAVATHWALHRSDDGEQVQVVEVNNDITDLNSLRIALHDERELLRVTLASIGDAVLTTDKEGRITSLNAVAESLTGWTNLDAEGQALDAVFNIVNEETRQPLHNPAKRALKEGVVVGLTNHTLLIAKDGRERPIDDSAAPIRSNAGEIMGCVLVFRDISERRRLEKENANRLRAARLLAAIVESSDDAIISKSLDGIIQSWNAAAERLFGFKAEQAVGRHISLIIPADRLGEEDRIIATLRAGQRIDHYETVRVRSDGQSVLVSLTISPIKDDAGQIIGASKIARDITGQRQAEERERRLLAEAATANAKFRAFFDQGPLYAGIMALDGTLLEANRLSLEACGYTKEQVIGNKFWECAWWNPSPDLMATIKAGAAQAAAGELFRAELPYFVADGCERMVDFILLPIKDESGQVIFLVPTGTDITDRKRAEAERQKFVTLVENSTDFIGMCDLAGVPFYVNRSGLEMVGLDSIEQARHTAVREFFFPDDQLKVLDEFFPSVLAKGHGEMEVRFRHFRTGKARWMAYKVLTLTDATGRAFGLATVSQDVTERRRLEDDLRKLAADLSAADRRKDEFLATLAHELRNPLAPIRNALQIIRLSSDREAQAQAQAMMQRQLAQTVRLVDDLLDVSRISRGKLELRREQVTLEEVIISAVETSRPLIDHLGHQLTVTLPEQPILVDADLTRLAQVFSNLLNNSSKYMDRGGHIWLTAERQGSDVTVSVKDTGIGIAADQLPRLFQMFSQVDTALERSQGGLGIGLTLVKRLVEMHDGHVEARSEGLGKGAEFVVRLPVLVGAAGPQPAGGTEEPAAQQSSLRILIVDDNRDAADSLVMLLRLMGNDTRTAYDGQQGVDVAGDFRPDVILLDIGLPKLNGYEACRRLREQSWGKNVVLIALTGWGQEEDRRLSHQAGFDYHMVKPVDLQELIKLLTGFQQAKS